jgi:hypothetical protein
MKKLKLSFLALITVLATVAFAATADKYISSSGNLVLKTGATKSVSLQDSLYTEQGGDVGIGISNPDVKLHIKSNDPFLKVQDSSGTGDSSQVRVSFYDDANVQQAYLGFGTSGMLYFNNMSTSGETKFNTGGEYTSVRITANNSGNSGGKVGIGTTSAPTHRLQIKHPTINENIMYVEGNASSTTGYALGVDAGGTSFRVMNNGKVGIGTTPDTIVHIKSNDPYLKIQDNAGTGDSSTTRILFYDDADALQAYLGFGVSGHLYFANISTAGSIKMQTNSTERFVIDNAGNIRFNHYGAGALSSDASGNITASDGRFKTKTRDMPKATDILLALKPLYYRWNVNSGFDTTAEEIGFIAQDIAKIIPEAAPKPRSKNIKWNYSDRALIAYLVKGFKEQQNIIDQQKAWICEQSNRPETLCH